MPNFILLKRFLFRLLMYGLLLVSGVGWAQSPKPFAPSAVQSGVMRLKVTPAFATQLEHSSMRLSRSNVVQTGVQTLDKVHQQFKASAMKRVFPDAGKYEAKHRQHGLHLWYEVRVGNAASLQSALSAYDALPEVTIAEPVLQKKLIDGSDAGYKPVIIGAGMPLRSMDDSTMPVNDPYLADQWHYNNTGKTKGTPGADIHLFDAWKQEVGKKDVIVAITDGGIDGLHPDLMDNIWLNEDEIAGNGLDDDHNGYVDDVHGYSFVDGQSTITPHSHGTHVAGTVAATNNNGVGVSGIAGGSGKGDGVRLMSCAVFKGETREDSEAGGFELSYIYAADNGAVISQNSWGHTIEDYAVEQVTIDAIDYFIAEAGTDEKGNQTGPMKGGIVIFAAGNSNSDGYWGPGNLPQTLAVSSTTHQDTKAYYSNYGDWVDIAAPGGETYPGGNLPQVEEQGILSTYPGARYAFFQGTSMACPHTSGVAALVVSKFGSTGFTPEMLRRRLIEGTDNINAVNPYYANLLGSGRLNAFQALKTEDEIAPQPITDLAAAKVGVSKVTLNWTSVADSSASAYDIRTSTLPITEANFETATPAPWKGLFIPKPNGSSESFVVKGLSGETTYYLAVKTVDYSGNASKLSNVVKVTTEISPLAGIHPTSLSVSLLTAQQTSDSFWISNKGNGLLEFSQQASTDSLVFGSLIPASGTIASGDSLLVEVIFSAADLRAGTYNQALQISTNDPNNELLTVALTLSVTDNNAPIVVATPGTLDFGSVFQGGTSSKTLVLHNGGSEPLRIFHVSSQSSDFRVTWADTAQLAPFQDTTLVVTYAPSTLGTASGSLAIETNDPNKALLSVELTGEGIPAPGISVNPDSIYASLISNEKKVELLHIRNTGKSNLTFAIQPMAAANEASAMKVDLSFPASTTTTATHTNAPAHVNRESLMGLQTAGTRPFSSEVTIKTAKTMGGTVIPLRVLILTPDPNVYDFEKVLDSFGDIQADVFSQDSLPTITAAALAKYSVVITTNNFQWADLGNVSGKQVGNVLADYIDGGGKVIVSVSGYDYNNLWTIKGRFLTEQYGPFVATGKGYLAYLEMGKKLAPTHPIMAGVDSILYSSYVQRVDLAPGATALAEWSNGQLLAAANANVVGINLMPTAGFEDEAVQLWAGNVPQLYYNAIRWLMPAPYLKVNPTNGVVLPGEEFTAEVTLDAKGMKAGHYTSALAISSNVPGQEAISVPVTLDIAQPNFTATPDSIAVSVAKGEKASRKFIVKNNGSGTYAFTVSPQNPRLSIHTTGTGTSSVLEGNTTGKTITRSSYAGTPTDVAIDKQTSGSAEPTAAMKTSYQTDFENFKVGEVAYQDKWGEAGEQGWLIDTTISSYFASSGKTYLHKISSGKNYNSFLYSPQVLPGSNPKSTVRMKVMMLGQGVTWRITPQSNMTEKVVTRILFTPDRGIYVLAKNEAGKPEFVPIDEPRPNQYFEITIEVDRATAMFDVFFNDRHVFAGQGFAKDIEQVSFYCGTEVESPRLYIDDFAILDGPHQETPSYVQVSPQAGSLAPGEQAEITVDFDAAKLGFGTYLTDLLVNVGEGVEELVVPTALTIEGAAAIQLNRTVLNAKANYRKSVKDHFEIENTGGSPLSYQLQVLGGEVSVENVSPKRTQSVGEIVRIHQKQTLDASLSKPLAISTATTLQVLSGNSLLKENFEGTFPPKNWESTGWTTALEAGEANYSGKGEAATLVAGKLAMDRALVSPVIAVKGQKNLALQYQANYQNYANADFLDLDIRVNGQESWTTVLHWNEDHGSLHGSGELVKVALDKYLQKAESFQVRWHYASTQSEGWYTQLDNVEVLAEAYPWMTVSPVAGTLSARARADVTVSFDAKHLEAGSYMAGIVVNSDAANAPQVGVVASLQVLTPPQVSVTPDSISVQLVPDVSFAYNPVIHNTGQSAYAYDFEKKADWLIVSKAVDQIPGKSSDYFYLMVSTSKMKPGIYQDTLYIHDLDSLLPSLKLPVKLEVLPGPPMLTIEPDTTLLVEVKAGQVATAPIIITNKGGTPLDVFVGDRSIPWASYSPNTFTGILPDSSVTVTASFDATTLEPGVYQDTIFYKTNDPRFPVLAYQPFTLTVLASPAHIEVTPSLVEKTMTVGEVSKAEFTIHNSGGTPLGFNVLNIKEIPWLSFTPVSEVVFPGNSQAITLTFDATALAVGVYSDTLYIGNSDPTNGFVPVPFTLTVLPAPVISVTPKAIQQEVFAGQVATASFTIANTGQADLYFGVNNQGTSWLSFNSTGGSLPPNSSQLVTLTFDATALAEGVYQDTLYIGNSDPKNYLVQVPVTLTVLPADQSVGVHHLSLVNLRSGAEIQVLGESLIVDAAHPEFYNEGIVAHTNPEWVQKVVFSLDGDVVNTAKSAPYKLDALTVAQLSKGTYVLSAQAYAGDSLLGKAKTLIISVFNSASVSGLEVVNPLGTSLTWLHSGDTLDISQEAFAKINLKAKVSEAGVGSVKFYLNGEHFVTDNIAPFSLAGDLLGYYFLPWKVKPGHYVLKATPYSLPYGAGVMGLSYTVEFDVVDGLADSGSQAGGSQGGQAGPETILTLYPVPVTEELTVRVTDSQLAGQAQVVIRNAQGQMLYQQSVSAKELHQHRVNLQSLSLSPGVYYLQLIGEDGFYQSKKFIKQ